MKEVLFIDTWGWVVIHNKREPRHYEVDALYRDSRRCLNQRCRGCSKPEFVFPKGEFPVGQKKESLCVLHSLPR